MFSQQHSINKTASDTSAAGWLDCACVQVHYHPADLLEGSARSWKSQQCHATSFLVTSFDPVTQTFPGQLWHQVLAAQARV